MPRLRRTDCSGPGIRRVRRGRGFSYADEDGRTVTDAETLARIDELVIPPAWRDVWICPHPNGHIQATGYDDAGRKQYLYHERWREHRDREKFAAVQDLAAELPRVRRRLRRDLRRRGLVRERVLACAVRLLDLGATSPSSAA
jgi:DNA topoisomerase-1